jgi:signal transduction histidine kinase
MKRLVLLIVVLASFIEGIAQAIDLKTLDWNGRFVITDHGSFLRTTQSISIDSALSSSQNFVDAPKKPVLVYKYDPWQYWFRFIVHNGDSKTKQVMLIMAPMGLIDGKLYQRLDNKWQPIAHSGLNYRFKDRTYQFTHNVFPVSIEANTTDTLYLSINANNLYKSFGFALMSPASLKIFENRIYFTFGIIEGLLILFCALNLSLFFALKDKMHLWYALYISFLFLIVLKNDHLDQQFLGLDSELAFRATPYLAIGAFALAILLHVVQTFFKNVINKNKNNLLTRACNIAKINVIVSAIVHFFVLMYAQNYKIHSFVFMYVSYSIVLCIFLVMFLCVYAYKQKDKSALIIFFGTSLFLIGSAQRMFAPSTLSFLFPPTTFHFGIIVETLVVSLGFIFRYWEDKKAQFKREEEVKTRTMHEISQEIHDNEGQKLALLKLYLETIGPVTGVLAEKIDETKKLVTEIISDVRELAKSLRTKGMSETGIVTQIENKIRNFEKSKGFQTHLLIKGKDVFLSNRESSLIMRIIAEALQNIMRHSCASLVDVSITIDNQKLIIIIHDDGKGFDVEEVKAKANGLINMQDRCELLNGTFKIESAINSTGTTIFLEIPIGGDMEKVGIWQRLKVEHSYAASTTNRSS